MERVKAECVKVLAEQACKLIFGLAELAGKESDEIVRSALEAVTIIDLEVLERIYQEHPDMRPEDLPEFRLACAAPARSAPDPSKR